MGKLKQTGWRRLLLISLAALVAAECTRADSDGRTARAGGDPHAGRKLLRQYDCGGCHIIPGVPASTATVGPPLTDWAERKYIAGALRNTPENLTTFILAPQGVEPDGGMPDMGVIPDDAGHIAAYLFTLGEPRPHGPPHPLPISWLVRLTPQAAADSAR
jgi:cytochrome c2